MVAQGGNQALWIFLWEFHSPKEGPGASGEDPKFFNSAEIGNKGLISWELCRYQVGQV